MSPNSLFADNAVLQRDIDVPIFGLGRDGESITVEFGGQKVSTVAVGGKWMVHLKPMPANATPQSMTITGHDTVVFNNIVVGDVWVASGQSNMERQLGPRGGQPDLPDWRKEVAAADYPLIREYYVPQVSASTPQEDANGRWAVCSPETAQEFSAVGYFFAREVHRTQQVPLGILFSAWGGTAAEVWTSPQALSTMSDFKAEADEMLRGHSDETSEEETFSVKIASWFRDNDPGTEGNWHSPEFAPEGWTRVTVPYLFDEDFDGVVWFRREIDLPDTFDGRAATVNLGAIDDADTTWINGVEIGSQWIWNENRRYTVPAGVLKPGKNVIAVRVLDLVSTGGFTSAADELWLQVDGDTSAVPLAGEWLCHVGTPLKDLPSVPQSPWGFPTEVSSLYNSMLLPLMRFPIKGVIWYQGEANSDRGKQYQTLFPLMISDWRKGWGQGDFPFLFVQIAPHEHMSPEIREAQMLTLGKSTNTGMAVTVDVGDAVDVHPPRKREVGERLALAARALAYGEQIEYSGPTFDGMTDDGANATISFTHVDGGLVAQGGDLKGFTIAGSNKEFVPAKATIEGGTVVVWSEQVSNPVAVRYGWANVPDVNLYNKAGLPASPFRTDVD